MRACFFAAAMASLVSMASLAATLEERVDALEQAKQAELYHTQEEKKAEPGIHLGDRISLSALLEVEASLESEKGEGEGAQSSSDLVLSTAQLGIRGKINEYFAAHLILLMDEEEIDEGGPAVEFDEATIDYLRGPWSARFGRLYVPFGEFISHFSDDPSLVDLGDTRETAVLVRYDYGDMLSVSAFVFGGDADRAGDSEDFRRRINDWGLHLKLLPMKNLEVGVGFLSDLAESDADWPTTATHYERRVAGWSAFGRLFLEPFEVSAEVVGAARRFDPRDLDVNGDGRGDRPLAWNVEGAWRLAPDVELAARMEGTREFFDRPRLQCGLGASWSACEGVTISASYLFGLFDADFSGGAESRHRVVTQLAVEF